MPTIKDVAKASGLSISTVSRYINKSVPISPDAEKSILDAIEKLKYIPNRNAGSLKSRESSMIAVVIPDILNPVFSKLILHLDKKLLEFKKQTIIFHTNRSDSVESDLIYDIISHRVFAIIIIGHVFKHDRLQILKNYDIKTVLVEDHNEGFDSVVLDNETVGKVQTEYLIKKNKKSILFAGYSESIPVTRDRYKAYKIALKSAGLKSYKPIITDNLLVSELNIEIPKFDFKSYDAIVCSNDIIAFGLLKHFQEKGIDVPKDISVIGCDNNPFCELVHPRLTTISFPAEDIANEIRNILFNKTNKKTKFDITVIQRDSIA